MTVLLSHDTALRFWRAVEALPVQGTRQRQSVTRSARQFLERGERPCFDEATFETAYLARKAHGYAASNEGHAASDIPLPRPAICIGKTQLVCDPLFECAFPLHVLVGKKNLGSKDKLLVPHVITCAIPEGSFVKAREGVLVSSPEFCFVQMAKSLSLPQLVKLGCELCGTYWIGNDGVRRDRQEPLTTKKKLLAFVESAMGCQGQRGARQALRWVKDGSNSPRETDLFMLLCLPNRLGAYGLSKPILNARIDLSPSLRKASGKSHYCCDLYWPSAKLAIEYDSDEHHAGTNRLNEDAIRRTNLNAMGIEVVTITNRQLKDAPKLCVAAKLLARKLHERVRIANPENFFRAQMELRKELRDFDESTRGALNEAETVTCEEIEFAVLEA